jgi:hypothetical protein
MQRQLRELPPLDLLRGFEAAARHLSFTKAAAELFLTQPAVSRQVHALEETIGVVLFQRRHRALLLTDAGQVLHRKVTTMMQELRETVRELRGSAELRTLTVTTTVTFASLWLVPRLPMFHALNPTTDVRISANNQLLDLVRERIDVAIRNCACDAAPPDGVRLFGEEVIPVCSPRLLRDRARPLRTPDDLRRHVLAWAREQKNCGGSPVLSLRPDDSGGHQWTRRCAGSPAVAVEHDKEPPVGHAVWVAHAECSRACVVEGILPRLRTTCGVSARGSGLPRMARRPSACACRSTEAWRGPQATVS